MMEYWNKQKYLIFGFLVILAFILYGNTIKNSYSLDDDYVTFSNHTIQKGIKAIPELFTSLYANVYGQGGEIKFGYRPIVQITYAIEYEFFGLNPHISHFINILLYAMTGIFLFVLLKRLFLKSHILFPLLVTVLFMAHPVHTEVVCSLKNRDELLSFMFNILTLIFFLKYADTKRIFFVFAALFSFLIAYLSKLTALSFIAVIPLVLFFFTDIKGRKLMYITLGIIIIFLLARFIPKLYLLPEPSREKLFVENPLIFENNKWLRTATGFYILLQYLKLLIFPHPLLFYYGYDMIPVTNWSNIWSVISFIIHLFVFIIAIKNFRKRSILSFGILFYLITISLYSNMVKPPTGIIGERFLLVPSLGFCIVLMWIIFRIFKTNPQSVKISRNSMIGIFLVSLAISIPYTAKTIIRNPDWKDHVTLLGHDIEYLERSAKANFIYAGVLKTEAMASIKNETVTRENMNKLELAVRHFKIAVDVYPEYYEALNQLGSLNYTIYHDPVSAISYLKRSIDANPEYKPAYFNLAYIYKSTENYDEAIVFYKKVLQMDPYHIQSINDMEDIYQIKGDSVNAMIYSEMGRKVQSGESLQ